MDKLRKRSAMSEKFDNFDLENKTNIEETSNEQETLSQEGERASCDEIAAAEVEGASANKEAKAAKKPFADAVEWVSSLVYAVLAMLVLNIFVFRSITVSGGSMLNTLQDQNKVISTNFFYTPQRGDIVVIQADTLYNRTTRLYGEFIIKRVIAVEGDTIRFDFENGIVYLNGEKLEENYTAAPTYFKNRCHSNVDYVVPEGHVFVMGDNRNESDDSRGVLGYVDNDAIIGKTIFRLTPFDRMGLL